MDTTWQMRRQSRICWPILEKYLTTFLTSPSGCGTTSCWISYQTAKRRRFSGRGPATVKSVEAQHRTSFHAGLMSCSTPSCSPKLHRFRQCRCAKSMGCFTPTAILSPLSSQFHHKTPFSCLSYPFCPPSFCLPPPRPRFRPCS